MSAMRKSLALLMWAAICLGGVAGAADVAKDNQVEIRNFAFTPRTLTVPAGTKVVWVNEDDEPHRIASEGGQFAASHALDTNDSYAVTFSKPGTYAYYCSIHPKMVGTVIVK